MSLLANRYARALFGAAESQNATDDVAQDLAFVARELGVPAVRALLLNPDVPTATRAGVVAKLVAGRHQLTRNLFDVLAARRRLDVLPDLQPAYHILLMEKRGEVEGTVETAHPLNAESQRAIEATANQLTGRKVVLAVKENPELIGGVRLRVGNTLYDSSVATAIAELEKQLLNS